jgi:hypothetical protein
MFRMVGQAPEFMVDSVAEAVEVFLASTQRAAHW